MNVTVHKDWVVADPKTEEVRALLARVATSTIPVLLLGETGVGKEIAASYVHAMSSRSDRPFIRINCAAISEHLLEGELFGFERGSFTGAVSEKMGLLEAADKGTVFLDEVGEMSPVIQAKLLRALEDNQVLRIGSVRPRRIDVRFVAATNRHLRDGAGDVRMRQDLYFRLNGISVRIPPLRDRPNEIIPLATHFLAAACARSRKCELHLSGEAIEALLSHRWPGNVRELRHVVERAALLCDGAAIRGHHLLLDAAPIEAADDRGPAQAGPLRGKDAGPLENMASWISPRAKVERLERARMVDALQACVGNQSRAARMLGIPRRTFVKKMVRYDIPRPRDERRHVDHHDSDAEAEAEAEEGAT